METFMFPEKQKIAQIAPVYVKVNIAKIFPTVSNLWKGKQTEFL